jgi:hypothetical protein
MYLTLPGAANEAQGMRPISLVLCEQGNQGTGALMSVQGHSVSRKAEPKSRDPVLPILTIRTCSIPFGLWWPHDMTPSSEKGDTTTCHRDFT